jgi:transcriptional regulator with XRE-family HTH domain
MIHPVVQGLEQYRLKRDLNQAEMAALIGVSQATYSRWVKGERTPQWDTLQRVRKSIPELPDSLFLP